MEGAANSQEDIAVLLPLLGKAFTPPDDPPLPPAELLQQQLGTAQPTHYSEDEQQEQESTPSYTSSATTESSTSRSMDTARLSGRAMELVRIDLWQYVGCLGLGLIAYVAFLLLPKGLRKAYCRSERRRYVRRFPRNSKPQSRHFADDFYNEYRDVPSHALERPTSFSKPTSSSSVHDSVLEEVEARRKQQEEEHYEEKPTRTRANSNIIRSRSDPGNDDDDDDDDSSLAWPSQAVTEEDNTSSRVRPLSIASSDAAIAAHQTPSPHKSKSQSNRPFTTTDMDRLVHDIASSSSTSNASPASPRRPAPDHPQIRHVPDDRIWRESLRRLGDRGVRLTAHGVQCDPKRIWLTHIQDDHDQHSLQWQTEFPRHVPNTETGSSSIVLMRGAVHTIPLPNVLYIDVGKKTSALQKTTALVPPSACFSLLTQQGSLDLQTNSKLERDAVVSALSYLLDHVHTAGDWRTLYQDSASTTVASSVVTGRDTPSTIRTTELVFPPTINNHTSAADI